jgi:hypothetical protein
MEHDSSASLVHVAVTSAVGGAPDNTDTLQVSTGDPRALDHLTHPSVVHLKNRLGDFCAQVLREARSIERAEHVGTGPPEITAAHIDEAWWVSRRRIRHAKHPVWNAIARLVEVCGVAGLGIGASNLKATWGPTLFVLSTVATIAAFLAEGFLARND